MNQDEERRKKKRQDSARYREQHPEKVRAWAREWARRHSANLRATETPEERERRLQKKRRSDAASYRRHRKKRLAKATEYREENRARIRERDTAYRNDPKRRAYMLKYLHEYRERNREAMAAADREYRRRNRDRCNAPRKGVEHTIKVNARRFLRAAVAHGVVFKPDDCEGCGLPTRRQELHGHHYRSYDHPLDVQWLCSICHGKAHRSGVEVVGASRM